MGKLLKSLRWLDDNLVKLLIFGYIFIIPLYPKFPIKIIDYTYIAVRAEDFYVALLVFIFGIQILRQKVKINLKFALFIVLFWLTAFASFYFGAFIQKTVIYKHLGLLHAARRIEYMIIFFIAASSVRSRKDFFFYLIGIVLAMSLACIYGIGQKFLGWPAVSTMNPEFAKGYLLVLTPEARVSSTFAGHYDLAAYLVLLIPLTLGLYLFAHNIFLLLATTLGIFVLNLTASRISAIAYIVSMLAFLLFIRRPKMLILIAVITALSTLSSSNLITRFLSTVQIKQIFVNEKTGEVVVPQKITSKELPAGTFYIEITQTPKEDQGKNEALLKERLLEEIRKEASQSNKLLSSTEEAQLLATRTAGLKPVNTVVGDISMTTRLQVEWPRAFNAFLKHPLFGAGPSAITESTDNDYLRWIGEFGLVGTLLFVYIIFLIAKLVWECAKTMKSDEKYVHYGFLFGIFGLMMNAGYIDVFEASKVAYTFWLVCGIFVGYITMPAKAKK